MTTHQKNTYLQVQLNSLSLLKFNHNLKAEDCAFTSSKAIKFNAAKLLLKERLER